MVYAELERRVKCRLNQRVRFCEPEFIIGELSGGVNKKRLNGAGRVFAADCTDAEGLGRRCVGYRDAEEFWTQINADKR